MPGLVCRHSPACPAVGETVILLHPLLLLRRRSNIDEEGGSPRKCRGAAIGTDGGQHSALVQHRS